MQSSRGEHRGRAVRGPWRLVVAAAMLVAAVPVPYGGLPTRYAYPELADMALAAPIVLAADISTATLLRGEAAAGVPAGRARYLIDADVRGLIAGRTPLPAKVRYLADLADDGRKAKLKGVPVLLLAAPSARPGELRLIGPRAQVPRTPENEARLRAILAASVAADAAPAITGVSKAFHVAGSLPGEGETQIFLRTADARPISLSILRRPGETPRWAVALGELVDASAEPPQPETFLWYRLACGLPPALPARALADLAPDDATQAVSDYRIVLTGLGPCVRGVAAS